MRLRDRHRQDKPEIIIIPMIDIMFFLLVFFMMSTLYMVNMKTVDVNMPLAQHAETTLSVTYVVTLRQDGSLWLADKPIREDELLRRAAGENRKDSRFAVVLRADQQLDYGMVMALLDQFKGEGITHIGLAAASAGGR